VLFFGKKKRWKQAARNYYIALLETLFRKAVEWKKVSVCPAFYLIKNDPHSERSRFATWEDFDRFWAKAPGRLR